MTAVPYNLAALRPHERTILWLKALIGAPTGKTVFLECLNRLRLCKPAWSNKTLSPVLETLRAKRLLTDALACPPELAHPLAVEAIASPDGPAMVEAVRACLPPDTRRYWDAKALEADTSRWLRLAVHLDDGAEFERLMELRGRYCRNAASPFDDFAAIAVGTDWFASRRRAFQVGILVAKADRWIATGIAAPDYPELMEQCRRDPGLRATCFPMIADFAVLTGRVTALATLLADIPGDVPADVPAAFAAVHALLSGDAVKAVSLFVEAQGLYRKASRKRKGGLPGYIGLLHLWAMLAVDDAGRHAEIEAALDTDEPTLGHIAARALLELARNRPAAARETVQHSIATAGMMSHPSPVSMGLLAVAAVLVDPALARQHAARLFVPLFHRLEHAMPLAAGMLAETLGRVAPTPAPYAAFLARPDAEVSFRFAAVLSAKAPWERTLDSLEALLSPAATEPATRSRRLVWQIDRDTGEIRPLEQTLQARGWSAGRAVSLKRLHQGDPALDYLDDFDRRAARSIHRSIEGWHGYGQETYECLAEMTLPALIGHPRVFDAGNRTQPVELVDSRAELVLSRESSDFRLALSHAAARPEAHIEVETPSRWRVVVIDAKAVAAAEVLGPKGVLVPAAARDRLAALARLHMPGLALRIDAAEIEDGSAVDGDPAPVLRLAPFGDGLKVSLVVRPLGPEGPYFLPGIGGRLVTAAGHRVRRDLDAEKRFALKLAEACSKLGGDGHDWVVDDLPSSLELLAELRSLDPPPAIEWPEGQRLSLRGEATAKRFTASVKGAENWFTIGGSVAIDEDLVVDLKYLLARLDRAQGRFVPLDDGGFLALDRHFRQQLERLRRLGDGLKLPAVGGAAVRDILEEAGSLKSDGRWKAFTRRLDEAADWQPRLPAGFAADLRDYQMEGFIWMSRLARWGAGALLADDMGLGKTVQAIAVMMAKAAEGPILVVAPTSVCGNWQAELTRFAPGLDTRRLAESGDRGEVLRSLGPGDVVIASYGLLGREEDKLAAVSWAMAVLDEAQAIKNADTQRAKASQRLNAGFRLALTGTPVENDPDELWSLFRFVNPGLLGSREAFGRCFAMPIARDNDAGAKAALKPLIRPFLLRRTKAAVLAELPARTEQTLLVELGEEERAFYEALRRSALERLDETADDRTRIHILAEITRLRRACCHPSLAAGDADVPSAKLGAFLELMDELREGRHRTLVFSQFVDHLARIRAALDAAGVAYQYLDGATSARERDKRVAAFQAGAGEAFLISLKAGGFGLNLTAADYVIHLDPWWNPAVEDQASDRAHRIGQSRPVTIYRLIVKDTIEEGILALHRRKRDLADALLEGADASARLSEEDLLGLIRGDG